MIHLLVVGPPPDGFPNPPAEVELLSASDSEEAIEKLARNRRIDAVLFFRESDETATRALLGEEAAAAPPFFSADPRGCAGERQLSGPDFFGALARALGEC